MHAFLLLTVLLADKNLFSASNQRTVFLERPADALRPANEAIEKHRLREHEHPVGMRLLVRPKRWLHQPRRLKVVPPEEVRVLAWAWNREWVFLSPMGWVDPDDWYVIDWVPPLPE